MAGAALQSSLSSKGLRVLALEMVARFRSLSKGASTLQRAEQRGNAAQSSYPSPHAHASFAPPLHICRIRYTRDPLPPSSTPGSVLPNSNAPDPQRAQRKYSEFAKFLHSSGRPKRAVLKTLRHRAMSEPLRLFLASQDGGTALCLWPR